jgi:hypothetical protein
MNDKKNRILGRILAVEETRTVHGAQGRDLYTGDPEGVAETTPVNQDTTAIQDDTSIPGFNETDPNGDSGTAADTGVEADCAISGTRRDIYIAPPDCP